MKRQTNVTFSLIPTSRRLYSTLPFSISPILLFYLKNFYINMKIRTRETRTCWSGTQLDTRKKFFTMRVVRPWPGCPERRSMLHSWVHFRPGWTGLWATWSSGRCLCSLQGGWTRCPWKVPSNPNHSGILRVAIAGTGFTDRLKLALISCTPFSK